MKHTCALAEFVSGSKFRDLPDETVTSAKRAILDFFGVAAFGSTTPWAKSGCNYVRRYGNRGSSVVIGKPWRASPRDAALLNGLFGHGFEMDDTHIPSTTHPGSVVIPAALAALRGRISGTKFLVAVVVGYEVMARVGFAAGPAHILRGFHPTGTVGVFGAAAAASVILGLTEKQTLAAIGIAGSFASGLMEFANDPWGDVTKRLHAGRAAESGLMAAFLAASGYRGPRSVLEGRQGFLQSYSLDADEKKLTRGLGDGYEIGKNLLFKPRAICSNIFAVVDALEHLRNHRGLKLRDVRNLTIHGNIDQVQYHAQDSGITTVMGAQYSIPFVVAATLKGLIDQPAKAFSDRTIRSKEIHSLCKRVIVKLDTKIDRLFPRVEAARVVVALKTGAKLEHTVIYAKGSPKNPLSQRDIERKFGQATKGIFRPNIAERVRQEVARLDRAATMAGLVRHLGA